MKYRFGSATTKPHYNRFNSIKWTSSSRLNVPVNCSHHDIHVVEILGTYSIKQQSFTDYIRLNCLISAQFLDMNEIFVLDIKHQSNQLQAYLMEHDQIFASIQKTIDII
jgi:hypothetical protein